MRRRYTAISSRLMGHRRQFDHLNRRDVISLLGSTAAAWPLTSHAQQPGHTRLICVLMPYAQSDGDAQSWLAAFRGALSKLGWTEGSNLRIELRWSADNPDRMRALANELVDLRPNTIFGVTTPVVGALARETKTIPIVFAGVSDPIASGFAANHAHPGGNITGFMSNDPAGTLGGIIEGDRSAHGAYRVAVQSSNSRAIRPAVHSGRRTSLCRAGDCRSGSRQG